MLDAFQLNRVTTEGEAVIAFRALFAVAKVTFFSLSAIICKIEPMCHYYDKIIILIVRKGPGYVHEHSSVGRVQPSHLVTLG